MGGWLFHLLLFCLLVYASPVFSRNWDDLYQPQYNIYGKEREEKFPIRAFVVEKESWPGHKSLEIFWLYRNVDYPKYRSLRLFPIFHNLESKIDNRERFVSLWYYNRIDGSERDRSWLWLYYRGEHAEQNIQYNALLPLWYRFEQTDTYIKFFTPLYYYEQNSISEQQERTFWFPLLPLFYNKRHAAGYHTNILWLLDFYHNTQENRNFVLPLWYYHNYNEAKLLSILPPLFWSWSSRDNSRGFILLPIMVKYEGKDDRGFFSPFYISIISVRPDEGSDIRLLLPLYLQYNTPNYNLHVNALGLSFSEEKLKTLPSVTHRQGKVSLDWDIGWLWYFFRLSGRTTVTQSDADSDLKALPALEPTLQREKTRARQESDSFLGIYSFFGISAYERADTIRHFRLLPLSWLTWDVASENKLQVIAPVYLNYRSETMSYFALVPFYGSQEKSTPEGMAHMQAWLLTAYIRESDPQEKRTEQSVLWPIVNWYETPEEHGFRIFPLFWHKKIPSSSQSWGYSPLHYHEFHNNGHEFFSVFGYSTYDSVSNSRGVWGLYHQKSYVNGNYRNFWLMPFYWSRSITLHRDGTPETVTQWNIVPVIFTETSREKKDWFILGHLHRRAPGYSFDSFAGLVSFEQVTRLQQADFGLLFYAINYRFRPGHHYLSFFWHLGGWWSSRENDFSVSLLTITGYEKTVRTDGSLLRHHRLLPLWWHTLNGNETKLIFPAILGYFSANTKDKSRYDLVGLGLLYYREARPEEERDSLQVLCGALYGYRWQQERNYRSFSSLWTLLWHYETEDDYNRFTLLKFIVSRTEKEGDISWRVLGIRL